MFNKNLEDFLNKIPLSSKVEVGNKKINLPLRYRCSTINLAFPISSKEAKKMMPSKNLKPLNILPGISLLCVTLFDFKTSDIGPFTEITTSIPVSYGGGYNITPISLIYKLINKQLGFYVVDIAQSSRDAINHGNVITGYPHYDGLISLHMNQDGNLIHVDISCSNELVLNLTIKRSMHSKIKLEEYQTYLTKDNAIKQITMRTYGLHEKSSLINLELGDHELANIFKKLKFRPLSLDTRYYNEMIKVIEVSKI